MCFELELTVKYDRTLMRKKHEKCIKLKHHKQN